MTTTSSVGLMFMFLVDAATLFWVAQLSDDMLVAAVGFAWTVQFFTISAGIGLAIAATALVSRAIGQGDWSRARALTAGSFVLAFGVQALVSGTAVLFREPILALMGADGETHRIASRFLLLSMPSLPLMAVGMVAGAVLRAAGDGVRAMMVTLSAGFVAVLLDPFLILRTDEFFGLQLPMVLGVGLGVDGAAYGVVASRATVAIVGLYFVLRAHDLVEWPSLSGLILTSRPFAMIAGPAILTQMSTPFGNALLTRLISEFGDSAVAGWSVVSRLTVLAFGGIFALSGAIGGIIGQNNGAGLMDRVKSAYRDSLIFCAVYTVAVWATLAALTSGVIGAFNLQDEGAEVMIAFTGLAAGGFVFTGAIFVANAAFNNLGRPLWSTGVNWLRDGVLMYPVAGAFAGGFAAPGVIYGQAVASVLVGCAATFLAWRFIDGLVKETGLVRA
ncbi:MAG: MATE family efflux transporter [Pseudomonadota bacterium]